MATLNETNTGPNSGEDQAPFFSVSLAKITGQRMLRAVLTCAVLVLPAFGAVADQATGAQSPEEIIRQLTPRGLPHMGSTAPAGPNPAISPANVPSAAPAPVSSEHNNPPTEPVVSNPLSTPAAHPSVTLRTITFEFGSARLELGSIEQLRNLGLALNQLTTTEAKLLIEGHTDKKGTRAYNEELSKRRADTVKDYLVKEMGVSADRLETVGKGFSEPANPKNPYAPENRRVVVVNIGAS
jgi:outer membrane protein OmpA-like peptidoglycan-associated protein